MMFTSHRQLQLIKLSCLYLLVPLYLCFFSATIVAQNTIKVSIDDAQVATTCTDFLGTPDPIWEISIENEGWITYGDAACFATTPNEQFTTTVDCLGEFRGGEIQVCFKVFENDPGFTPCNLEGECEVSLCEYIVLPLPGQDSSYVLSLPDNGASSGQVAFSITVTGELNGAPNDHICHALDLGTLQAGMALGKEELGVYNNLCASEVNEANPKAIGGSFTNNVGVWFRFTTGDTTDELIIVESNSDPENTGDFINLQLALYQATDGACDGELTYITDHHDPSDFNEYMILECLDPNQEYYILVDGVFDETDPQRAQLDGFFSLRIRTAEVTGKNDQICEAIPIAIAAEGTAIYTNFFNNCATNVQDPTVGDFPSIKPVWFQFTPSVTRRVAIEAISNLPFPIGIDPIQPQIAIYESSDNTCAGALTQIAYQYPSDNQIAALNLECLDPAKTYWLMVDGSANNPTGVFDISIADLGYPDLTIIDTVICEGSQLVLGDKMYSEVGIYLDTVVVENGCLEIIQTTLNVADSISVAIDIAKIAGGLEVPDGIVELTITGGSGNYDINWSNGLRGRIGEKLIGGEEYCVTVSDVIGCSRKGCFVMPYVLPIQAHLDNDTLDCFGDTDGQLRLSIDGGQAPYQYMLQSLDGRQIESGTIVRQKAVLFFSNLAAGTYNLILNTEYAVSEMIGRVMAPPAIAFDIAEQQNASCFGSCDAAINLQVEGGNGDFQFAWQDTNLQGQNPNNLCAGAYQVTVTDKKKCIQIVDFTIQEPTEFIATAVETQSITCFGEANGQATVTTNGTPIAYLWDNGITTPDATSLKAGTHQVLVVNEEDCTDTAFVEIKQPDSALEATIEVIAAINCFGEHNGLLKGIGTGGNGDYQYEWNNAATASLNDNLPTGEYQLTVTDQLGCTAIQSLELEQPSALVAAINKADVTCPGGPKSGVITIDNIIGGVAPYAFSLDGNSYADIGQFDRLPAATYQVGIQDGNGCEITKTAIIKDPPALEVTIGEDQTVKLGKTLELEALSNRDVTYQWSSFEPLPCENCPTQDLQPMASANYKVTVTDKTSACTATDEVFVAIDNAREVFVPTAFSPNGDGSNDALMIYGGNDIRQVKAFKVFDRHGTLVYQADNFAPNDPSVSWRGEFRGQKLASSLYIYWAEVEFIDGYSEVYKGDVALLR